MAATIAELLVKIGVSVDGAKRAEQQIADLGKTGKTTGQTMQRDLAGGIDQAGVRTVALGNLVAQGATALAGLAVQAIRTGAAFAVDLVKGFASAGDEIAKTARQLGVGAESLQRLRFAAERSGVSTAALERSFRTLQTGLIDARERGVGPAVDGLELLGLTIEDVPVDDAEAAFGVIADALRDVESEAERSSIAADLFGQRAGIELKSLLAEGSEGIDALGDRAEALGGVLGEDTLTSAEQLTDAFTDLQTLFEGVKNTIGAALAPTVTDLVNRLTEFVRTNDDLITQDIPKLFDALAKIIPPVVEFAAQLVDGVAFLVTEFQRFNREAEDGIGSAKVLRDVFATLAAPIRTIVDLIGQAIGALDRLADRVNVLGSARDRIQSAFGIQAQTGAFATDQITNQRVSATDVLTGARRGVSAESVAAERRLTEQLESESQAREAFFAEQQQAEADAAVRAQRLATGRTRVRGSRGRSGGGRATRDAQDVVSSVTFEDVLRGVIGGRGDDIARQIGGLASRTPSAAAIKPTVAIDFFNFQVTQNITGRADPAEIGRQASEAIRREFRSQTARAGNTLSSNIVR
jgi:TP901 family phage tail tape measure protein